MSACSDTIQKSSSDDTVFRRKNTRNQRESRHNTWTRLQLHTDHSSRVHIIDAHKWCTSVLCFTPQLQSFNFIRGAAQGLKNKSAHAVLWTTSTAEEPHHGGYAGSAEWVRTSRPRQRPAAQEEPCPRRTRIDETGDPVPGSHDSITRGIRILQLANVPAAEPDRADRALPTMPNSRRHTQKRLRHQRSVSFNVLSAAQTHLPTPAIQTAVSWRT